MRSDGREPHALRPVRLTPGFMPFAEGSCLVEMGLTRVICTATIEDSVPRWMQKQGRGWVTAEYQMLPRSSPQRVPREVNRGRVSGRTQEIQRLVGRSLRAVTDLAALGERSILIDCDVLQADGGTRTASITGAYVALHLALDGAALEDSVAAVSVGVVDDRVFIDLDYSEDSGAGVDMNVVMTGAGELVEVQGTAEGRTFGRDLLDEMIDGASTAITELTAMQKAAIGAGSTA
ncbi:MAG TPA: ribonuclease PH [Actinomycetota bacterium]|nr:ribonuclease PH [Actinomycetota bacterium]